MTSAEIRRTMAAGMLTMTLSLLDSIVVSMFTSPTVQISWTIIECTLTVIIGEIGVGEIVAIRAGHSRTRSRLSAGSARPAANCFQMDDDDYEALPDNMRNAVIMTSTEGVHDHTAARPGEIGQRPWRTDRWASPDREFCSLSQLVISTRSR